MRVTPNFIATSLFMFGFIKWFTYSLKQDKFREFNHIYETYKKDTLDSKYKGLKLYRGKHMNKIQEREFTTSNLEDLKSILNS